MKICIIEDEAPLAQSLQKGLKISGFNADYFLDGKTGRRHVESHPNDYDAVILDLMLPEEDGLEVCRNLRAQNLTIPILVLSALYATENKTTLLNAGADDYLVKPFAFDELVARLRALLRRPEQFLSVELATGDLRVSINLRKVYHQSREISLSAKEFAVLEYLMRHPNQVISRQQLLNNIWDSNFDIFSNVVDALVKNLRNKLRVFTDEEFIETVRGVGYRFKK